MKKPCGNTHPYFNASSIQTGRTPILLLPENVAYDERTVSDWLVYLNQYAQHINFFALADVEVASGTWKDFGRTDISMLLARIAEEQVAFLQSKLHTTLHSLQHDTFGAQAAKNEFTQLFSLVFNIVYRLDGYYKNLPGTLDFREKMANRIFSKMEIRLTRLVAYYKAAKAENLFEFGPANPLPEGYQSIENLENWLLSSVWHQQNGAANWADFIAAIAADASPFEKIVNPPATPDAKINLAARYQLLVESAKGILAVFAAIIADAKATFEATINQWPSHVPDKALLLSFLRVLELYRLEINTFTKKHLDFYYKEVLQLHAKQSVADNLFLVVEPAKNQTEFLLPQGTKFKGGKDAQGVERLYSSYADVVINQAKVVAKKAVFKSGNLVYTAQNVGTQDGLEKELEFPENGYPAFGTNAMPEAEIGFAVASHYLYLREGERTVTVIISCRHAMNTTMIALIRTRATMRVSGEKGWINLKDVTFEVDASYKVLKVSGKASSEEKPIVAIEEKLHERSFYPNLPVVEVLLASRDYNYLKNQEIENVQVEVIANECQQLDAFANGAKVDLAKPFLPFGALPKSGNELVFDSQEMMTKTITSFSIQAQWQVDSAPQRNINTIVSGTSKFKFEQKSGTSWIDKSVDIIDSENPTTYEVKNLSQQNTDIAEVYSKNATKGFLRIRLNGDLGHSGYPTEVSNHIISLNVPEPPEDTAVPLPYYTPALEWVKVNYTAKSAVLNVAQSSSYKTTDTVFMHITPFGGYEASGNMLNQPYPGLLPKWENQGELYVGLSDFKGGQTLQLLVGVVEGSSNPLKAKQEVTWQYLENNRWVDFANGQLSDQTNGLVQTGIVRVALPFNFDDNSTFFNEKLTWIRATVAQHTDAICLLKDAFAQGIKVTLSSTGHADEHFAIPLEAATVAKLQTPNAAVKKLNQPYAAFGGKPTESDSGYYQRISERLRHKNRSITIWDYERLILEEFPEIAKVKTLSHTRYDVNKITNQIEYSESAPGHVAVVCVPQKSKVAHLFEVPYTPFNTLEKVEDLLSTVKPEWAVLHVRNPIFEFVQVDFRVQFNPEITDTDFYKTVLETELKNYLSPWKSGAESSFRFDWRIHKSAVIDFLDERPYVDYVRDVKLNVLYNSDESEFDVDEARPRFAVSVLISATNHVINLV